MMTPSYRDVSFTDAGDYTCVAENKFGQQEAHGSLVVKERTRITNTPEDYEVAAGQTATFRWAVKQYCDDQLLC